MTLWARLSTKAGQGATARCQMTVNATTCIATTAAGGNMTWCSNTCDVTGLVNGTAYLMDFAFNNSAAYCYCSAIVVTGS